jgi:serine O-acetyltransferase
VKDVPPNSTVVGVPARLVMQNGVPVRVVPERPQVDMPDPNADAIARLQRRVVQLEGRLQELEQEETGDTAWSWVI